MRQPLPQCDCDHRDDDCDHRDDACDDACDFDWDGDEEHCLSPESAESFNVNIITIIIVIIAI